MSTENRLTGKVAAILSDREIMITVGADEDVAVGMKFVVLSAESVPVHDPDDPKTVLGETQVPKTVVKIVRVAGPRLSVARTFRTVKGSPGILGAAFGSANAIYGSKDRIETLEVAPGGTLRAALATDEAYVKVGDPVIETTGDEYDDLS